MKLFDKLTGKAKREAAEIEARLQAEEEAAANALKERAAAERKAKREAKKAEKAATKSAKDIATEKGEPYISIVSVELDPENIGNGAFELDWNDKFITNLVRCGYQLKPGEAEDVIVDRWFQDICKNVVAENYEQWEANQPSDERLRTVGRKDLGNGRTEIS
jgi:hypothetical protein